MKEELNNKEKPMYKLITHPIFRQEMPGRMDVEGTEESESRQNFVQKLTEDERFSRYLRPELLRDNIHTDWLVWGAPGD